jgi:hypothetical protein
LESGFLNNRVVDTGGILSKIVHFFY